MVTYGFVFLTIVLGLGLALVNYLDVRKMPEEIPAPLLELAAIIRRGANVFMKREYRIIIPVGLGIALFMTLFVEQASGLTLLLGGCMSSATCIWGMKGATYANVRTTHTASRTFSNGRTVQMATRGGSVSGLSVHSFGLLGLLIVILVNLEGFLNPTNNGRALLLNANCNPVSQRLFAYSLGCSVVALFNRVAGGNYTKAADISADIVAKNVHNMPEDDSRMPNTIADFIGDNVNDIAGNCSDLLESFVATVVSAMMNATMQYQMGNMSQAALRSTLIYPLLLASCGLLSCTIAVLYITRKGHNPSDTPAKELNLVTYIASGSTLALNVVLAYVIFHGHANEMGFRCGWVSPWIASACGIFSGVAIGKLTEYYTGMDKRPVREIAEFSREGEAFNITKCDAVGERSSLAPSIVIGLSIIIAPIVCGTYGIAVASVGMLSFVGAIVSIDAFGPIADNAGGIAESCHLDSAVREVTDAADAAGNTTAAIGKGLAIGSAAFATISLITTYVSSYTANLSGEPTLNIVSPVVMAGAIIGAALIKYFSGVLTDNTIDSAYKMAEEGERQLAIPGVLEYKVTPDYDRVITMASDEALRKMLKPSLLMLLVPVFSGMIFGPELVGGILIGATIVAIPDAIFMGNSGGAADNAKKYIESGLLVGHGKGSLAHRAAVAGDTTGDTRKDVVGVALDIGIKEMSITANTMAPVFAACRIF